MKDLNENPIEVSVARPCQPDACYICIQGLTVEPVEVNIFDWECTIKASVSRTAAKKLILGAALAHLLGGSQTALTRAVHSTST